MHHRSNESPAQTEARLGTLPALPVIRFQSIFLGMDSQDETVEPWLVLGLIAGMPLMQGCSRMTESHTQTGLCELVNTRKQDMPTWYQREHSQSRLAAYAEAQLPHTTAQCGGLVDWLPLLTSNLSNYLTPQSLGLPSRPRSTTTP